jgi:hypothetical protein
LITEFSHVVYCFNFQSEDLTNFSGDTSCEDRVKKEKLFEAKPSFFLLAIKQKMGH